MFIVKDPSTDVTIDNFAGPEIVDIGITCSEGIAVIRVSGELDVSNAQWLYECLHDAMDAGILEIVLDLERLTFMDSIGLSVLSGANRRMAADSGRLTVLSPTPIVKKLFDTARVVPSLNVRAAA
jgi:anti-anti-sigma factor